MELFGLGFGFNVERNSNEEFWKGFGWPCINGRYQG